MEKQRLVLMLSFQSCQDAELMKYVIDFDKEASSVYTRKVNSEFN